MGRFDIAAVRREFPILHQEVNGHPLVYLDNAASMQKPAAVIDAIARYYRRDHSNVHRGAHALANRATEALEHARQRVADFLGGVAREEILWTRGTTESINLVANSWGRANLRAGDEILLTAMEHHANIVPWQMVAQATGARIRVLPVTDAGALELAALPELLNERTRLVAVTQVSNALGTLNPVAEIVRAAHAAGALVLVDGAQAVNHLAVDVRALGADFYAFSGHKLFGPTGIGVLYGRRALLDAMPPWQGGGEMIERVSFAGTTYAEVPWRFEAGTPHIAGAIGLGAAIAWLQEQDREAAAAHERALLARLDAGLDAIPGVRRIGTAAERVSIASFVVEGTHPTDVGLLLDQQGVAVRAGHHCAMPLMERLGIPGTVRASLALYNTAAEVDRLLAALDKALGFLR
ncbi:MAG: SufS family cysteine desulfurase [Pseudomonadota bacterium]